MEKDQRLIESVLEAERLRVEEGIKAVVASRKARDEKEAKDDAEQEGALRCSSRRNGRIENNLKTHTFEQVLPSKIVHVRASIPKLDLFVNSAFLGPRWLLSVVDNVSPIMIKLVDDIDWLDACGKACPHVACRTFRC